MVDEGSIQGQVTAEYSCIQDVKLVNKKLNIAIIRKQIVLIKPMGLKIDQNLIRKEIELIFEMENHELDSLKEVKDR